MKNFTRSEILDMPTFERRYYLGLLTKDNVRRQEEMEAAREQAKTSGSKGTRSQTISGNALKNQMKSGNIPLN